MEAINHKKMLFFFCCDVLNAVRAMNPAIKIKRFHDYEKLTIKS